MAHRCPGCRSICLRGTWPGGRCCFCGPRWAREAQLLHEVLASGTLYFDQNGQLVVGSRPVATVNGRQASTPLFFAYSPRRPTPLEPDGARLRALLVEQRAQPPRPAEAAGDTEEEADRA